MNFFDVVFEGLGVLFLSGTVLAGGGYAYWRKKRSVKIPLSILQSGIRSQLPIKKTVMKGDVSITQIDITPDTETYGRLNVDVYMSVSIPNLAHTLFFTASGRAVPEYKDGHLYLKQLALGSYKQTNVEEDKSLMTSLMEHFAMGKAMETALSSAKAAVSSLVGNIPIYSFDKKGIESIILKNVSYIRAEEDGLLIGFRR